MKIILAKNISLQFESVINMFRKVVVVLLVFFISCLVPKAESLGINDPSPQKISKGAEISYQYSDLKTGRLVKKINKDISNKYAPTSSIATITGRLIHIPVKNTTKGCINLEKDVPPVQWIALIKIGKCRSDYNRITKSPKQYNLTAVLIYSSETSSSFESPVQYSDEIISVYTSTNFARTLENLIHAGNSVEVTITPSNKEGGNFMPPNISKTSVLFVSISFIVLMIISLAWLVFYYIQRFRYAHAKERLSRRLANAAKKAISRIPQRTVKAGDKELEKDYDQCAVCIEVYRSADVIRILPCKHVFHKSCVDPWLMEQRSCPMCKMDILRAFGLQLNGSQESVVHVEAESGTVSGIEPEPLSSPGDMVTAPVSTPSTGPKLMQFSHPSVQFHSAPDHDPDTDNHIEIQQSLDLEHNSPLIKVEKNIHVIPDSSDIVTEHTDDIDREECQSLMTSSRSTR